MTWPESVDQTLCFGWIDGVRRRVDDVSYTIRFTPRLKANQAAWLFFQKLAPSYRYLSLFHVVSARQEETHLRRLDQLIRAWTEGRRGW